VAGRLGKFTFLKSALIKNPTKIQIGTGVVSIGGPVFVIAEAGVNHNGDIELAKRMVDVAKDAGADAVKFQTFKAESLATIAAPKAEYQLTNTASTETQLEMLRQLELSEEAHREVCDYCAVKGITFLSTPFDADSADFLETLHVPAFKISSGDLTNLPLLEHIARKGRPVILSTGMATLQEVRDAVNTISEAGCRDLILLHCVTNYPALPSEINLRAMTTMRDEFGVPVGFSDHTEGTVISLAAVALGATVIEKHFTLDKNFPGPDHKASLEPEELQSLIKGIRAIEVSLGDGEKCPTPSEFETAKIARRSIIAATDIPAGSPLRSDSLVLKRPGTGLPPSMLKSLVGKVARVDITEGTLIDLEMLES